MQLIFISNVPLKFPARPFGAEAYDDDSYTGRQTRRSLLVVVVDKNEDENDA